MFSLQNAGLCLEPKFTCCSKSFHKCHWASARGSWKWLWVSVSKPWGGHEQTISIDTCRVEVSAPMAYESWRRLIVHVTESMTKVAIMSHQNLQTESPFSIYLVGNRVRFKAEAEVCMFSQEHPGRTTNSDQEGRGARRSGYAFNMRVPWDYCDYLGWTQ